jgi:DNA-binding XRE family transcriptional regulator
MEHEEKSPASLTPPDPSGPGRARVESAANGGGVSSAHSDKPAPEKVDRAASEAAASEAAASEAAASGAHDPKNARGPRKKKGAGAHPNNLRRLRIERMMSKAELARRANLSVLTIDRVEKGFGCRMDTKRKILEALGLSLGDRVRVFGEEE